MPDVYLYRGESNPNDVRLLKFASIFIAIVGIAASPAIGSGSVTATVAISGVSASPAIGTVTFNVKTPVTTGVAASPAIGSGVFSAKTSIAGVAASPAIGVGSFSSDFTLSGVVANAQVGATQINVSEILTGVAADPEIGTGTVETPAAGDVIVNLDGVAADPQIGVGTVTIQFVRIGGAGESFRARPVKPKRLAVLVLGEDVRANATVGNGSIKIVKTITNISLRGAQASARIGTGSPTPDVIVSETISEPQSAIGTGEVKRVIELLDDELIALMEAA